MRRPQCCALGLVAAPLAMARKQSAGTLLYTYVDGALHVLLVHPSGSYNRRAPWSIPKGLVEDGEDLETTARRETLEETGVQANQLVALGWIDYTKSRKRVHAFVGPIPPTSTPRCASWEIDQAELMTVERAREIIHPDQAAFLDRLLAELGLIPGH